MRKRRVDASIVALRVPESPVPSPLPLLLARQRQIEAALGEAVLSGDSLADLLAEHGCVVPGEAQFRIRSEAAEHPKRFGAARIVVKKNVALLTLDQGQHVDVVRH